MLEEINNYLELSKYMDKNIEYGYMTKDGKVLKYDDPSFERDFFNQYVLSSYNDVLKNKLGNCFDQVEFEREWFTKHNYKVKTYFEYVNVPYDNDYETHTFLVFEDNNKWYYFENADFNNRGVHQYNSLEELLKDTYNRYLINLEKYNLNDKEISSIEVLEYSKPKENSSFEEFFKFVNGA